MPIAIDAAPRAPLAVPGIRSTIAPTDQGHRRRRRARFPAWRRVMAMALGTVTMLAQAAPEIGDSEAPFFETLPIVLSGSRLPQPLRDVPGAMTVIDRDVIRRSGARDLADVLRWIPGFQVAQSTNGNNAPLAVYHGLTNSQPRSMQILIDGRSQYSPLWFGGVNFSVLQVALEDIERIEVLRGSNSAAFGSNALLGVINIVTTEPAQARGTALKIDSGNQGVGDAYARLGWGSKNLAQRLSVSRQTDDGLAYFRDSRVTRRAEWRGDRRLPGSDELQLTLGKVDTTLGVGLPAGSNNDDDPERDRRFTSGYLQATWTRPLAAGGNVALRYFHVRESGRDVYVLSAPPFSVPFDFQVKVERDDLEFQHIAHPKASVRLVWGAGWRRDSTRSRQFFGTDETLHNDTRRLFGHIEWRPATRWLVNVGGTWEDESLSGKTFSPRLMLNFQPNHENTLRVGVYRAHRTPSFLEQRVNIIANDPRFPTPPDMPLAVTERAAGGLKAERLRGLEASYLGEFRRWGLSVDARAFHERLDILVVKIDDTMPGICIACVPGGLTTTAYINGQDARIGGFEYQLRWQTPWAAQIWFNQTHLRLASKGFHDVPAGFEPGLADQVRGSAPHRAESIHWLQDLLWGANLTASYAWSPSYKWTRNTTNPGVHRLDWRLALPFKGQWGKGELAWTARADNGPLIEYRIGEQRYKQQIIEPRHWLSLRIDI